MTVEIPLANGRGVALIDDADLHLVDGYAWRARVLGRSVHARTDVRDPDRPGGRRTVYMHRLILGLTDPKAQTDHVNCDGLDNRRNNLRVVTSRENRHNQRPRRGTLSKYKGVYLRRRDDKWYAQIEVDGRGRHLGYFDDEVDAARAYDAAAIKHFGEFARLNFCQTPALTPPGEDRP